MESSIVARPAKAQHVKSPNFVTAGGRSIFPRQLWLYIETAFTESGISIVPFP